MGIGDELMVAGAIKRLAVSNPGKRFAVIDTRKLNIHRWNDIWEGNPLIAKPGEEYDLTIENRGGKRPYITFKTPERWHWLPYSPEPADLYLSDADKALAYRGAGRVVVNPTIKANASPNKQWGQWQALVDASPGTPWLEIGDAHPVLKRVDFVQTASFRLACGVLSSARAAVLHEGGLHHAAAALGVRAVVIYGGFIAPACTGYNTHRNLFSTGRATRRDFPLGCGMRAPCGHCADAMRSITPAIVLHELMEILH